jgi:hypothetical protein
MTDLLPLHRHLGALVPMLLEDDVGSIEPQGDVHRTADGCACLGMSLSEAPRDWLFDKDAFARSIEGALELAEELVEEADASREGDLVRNWRAACAELPDNTTPFASPSTLMMLTEPDSDANEIMAVGNLDGGWLMVLEGALGEYTDDDTDAYAELTVYFGSAAQLDAVLRRRAIAVMETACSQVVNVLHAAPEQYRPALVAARQAYAF